MGGLREDRKYADCRISSQCNQHTYPDQNLHANPFPTLAYT